MQLSQGTLLQGGKYRIEKVLGQGGFGITYLAVQVGLNRKVAVKEFFMKEYCNRDGDTSHVSVPSEGSRDLVSKFRTKFVKEAQTIAEMNNPHIIRIYDVFEENGTAYYVMEHVGGGSLNDLVGKGTPLSPALAEKYIRQVADALDYCHDKYVTHLDVKPSNILLNGDSAVLIDFGISKHYDSDGGNQTSSTPVGISKGYAPIEQYKQGGVADFSPSTDIYSLGATLYKLVTGKTPPEADVVYEDGLPELPSSLSLNVRTAISRSMQPRRKDRPQSISEFLALLDAPVAGDDVESDETEVHVNEEATVVNEGHGSYHGAKPVSGNGKPSGAAGSVEPSNRRGKGLLLGVLSGVVASVLGVFLYVWFSGPGARRDDDLPEIRESGELLSDAVEVVPVDEGTDVLVEVVSDDGLQDMQQKTGQQSAAAAEAERKRVEAENARIAAEKAEQERVERERKEREAAEAERKRVEAENARIAAEKAEQERKRAAAAEAERKRQEEVERKRNEIAYRDGVLYVKGVEYPMVYVSGGTFRMGSDDSDAFSDEKPVHSVTLSSYRIGQYEVTQDMWEAVMGSNPSYFKGSRRPIENVSWEDCQTFIRKLNDLTGQHFRLPTEAEWEFAARGGNSSWGCKYSGSSTVGNVAWYDENSGKSTHDVGTKSPNELGVYDMSGNVWEWCQDWYGSYSSSSQTNPKGPASGSYRVNRGGSWFLNARFCRVSARYNRTPDFRYSNLGFRLCL